MKNGAKWLVPTKSELEKSLTPSFSAENFARYFTFFIYSAGLEFFNTIGSFNIRGFTFEISAKQYAQTDFSFFFNYRQFSVSLQLVSLFSNTAPVRNVYITPIYEQSLRQIDVSAATFNFHNITERNKILKDLNGNKLSIYVSVIINSVVGT